MAGRPIPRGGHLRILISENCPWSLDHFLLKLLSAWFYRGSKNKALPRFPSISENVLISLYLYWLLRVHLDPLINSQKERWSLDSIWSQSKTLLQVILTCILRKGWSCFTFFRIVLGQRTKCVCSQWPLADFSTIKQWRTFLQCGQVIKQQKWWSKLIDPGLSYDYSACGSDHTLYSIFIPFWLQKLRRNNSIYMYDIT